MGYLLAILLYFFAPAVYEAKAVDCAELAEVLQEAVELGVINDADYDRFLARCIKQHGE